MPPPRPLHGGARRRRAPARGGPTGAHWPHPWSSLSSGPPDRRRWREGRCRRPTVTSARRLSRAADALTPCHPAALIRQRDVRSERTGADLRGAATLRRGCGRRWADRFLRGGRSGCLSVAPGLIRCGAPLAEQRRRGAFGALATAQGSTPAQVSRRWGCARGTASAAGREASPCSPAVLPPTEPPRTAGSRGRARTLNPPPPSRPPPRLAESVAGSCRLSAQGAHRRGWGWTGLFTP